MTKPTIYITDTVTGIKYKVVDVNKQTSMIKLLIVGGDTMLVASVAEFTGSRFKVDKVAEQPESCKVAEQPESCKGIEQPEPMTEQEEVYVPPRGLASQPYPFGEPDGYVAPANEEPMPEATSLPMLDVSNRKEAVALSEAYKIELKPILDRMKAVKEAVEKGHKGEAKKIAYVIQWAEKYLAD